MNEQMLFRLAMILQSQAPSTLNKAICKLAETILCDHEDGLSIAELQDSINQQFNLAFSSEEIKNALDRKARNEVFFIKDKVLIRDHVKQKVLAETPYSESLRQVVEKFCSVYSCEMKTEEISDLLIRYLYYGKAMFRYAEARHSTDLTGNGKARRLPAMAEKSDDQQWQNPKTKQTKF